MAGITDLLERFYEARAYPILSEDGRLGIVGDISPELRREVEKRKGELKKALAEKPLAATLLACGCAGLTLEVSMRNTSLKVSPREALTPELTRMIKRHKEEIVEAIRDDEYRKTGVIQCERQVFELARKWKSRREEEQGG